SMDARRKQADPQFGASSHDELAARLLEALDGKDFKSIRFLVAPAELWAKYEMFGSDRDRQIYEAYRTHSAAIGKALWQHLSEEELLPLRKATVQPVIEVGKPSHSNGGTFRSSTGVFLLNDAGAVHVELADQAVSINGRWFVTRLFTDERELEKHLPREVARELKWSKDSD
ncbi:MAG TPA: hypothetical protein VE890_06475, partial [Thermoguttaceae bacterium]|nr:hypothetical protein [Thermoguttaceae bacterium]